MAGLGPISYVEFEKRLETMKEESEKKGKNSSSIYCQVCKKGFSSSKALRQHEKSRRHLLQTEGERTNNIESYSEIAKPSRLQSEAEDMFITPGTCLFDGKVFDDVATCLRHMAVVHGFRIPFWDSLDDLEGLLMYLGSKVGEYSSCVFCDKQFSTLQSLRDHMSSKNHCRMKDKDEAWLDEFGEFYNFADEGKENPLVPALDGLSGNENDHPLSEAFELCLPRHKVGHRAFALYYRQRPRREKLYSAAVLNGQLRTELHDYHKFIRKLSEDASGAYLNKMKRSSLAIGLQNNYIKKLQQRKHISALNSGY